MTDAHSQLVYHYHQQTKHHPQRYARSLGYLDWETQPVPFRRFEGAPMTALPLPETEESPDYADIYCPGAIEPTALTMHAISRLLYCSLALSAWKQAGVSRWALRCNPSSGNLHPTEGYLLLPAIEGLDDRPGLYHYAPYDHALEQRGRIDRPIFDELIRDFPAQTFFVGLSSIHWREAWKYGERAFRYCQQDVGHALAALRLSAAGQGWQLVMLEGLSDEVIASLLGLDRQADFPIAAEREHPDLVAAICPYRIGQTVPRTLDPPAVERIRGLPLTGQANTLSPEHVDWNIIEHVAGAAHKPSTAAPAMMIAQETEHKPLQQNGHSFQRIARQRRSAVAFDGHTSIPADIFFHILNSLLPERSPTPWDALSWRPHVHLLLFVHLVDGLEPGVYFLARDRQRLADIQQACNPELAWTKPEGIPDALPLYLLIKSDCRRAAAQLSLGQEIAGAGAFSLGMLGEFDRGIETFGAWFYRRLFWEAGMIGQVLYLEAEAAGLRGTGIGAYFDDWVHQVAGIENTTLQSMYHFTVGGPVDDPRLQTLPTYGES